MAELIDIAAAEHRIRSHVRETPLEHSAGLSALTGAEVYLKLEHTQHTGSFKVRGALNRILALDREERQRGVVTASSGNHGKAVAWSAKRLGIRARVFLSTTVPAAKMAAVRALGAEVVPIERDNLEVEIAARAEAERSGETYVSPYNDPLVVAGQGTLGAELGRQLERIDSVFIAVGGGGLVSGVGLALEEAQPSASIVGCWAKNSQVLYQCLKAGRIIEYPEEPTLSDSTAGGIEPGSVTFPLAQRVIDDMLLLSEAEIRAGFHALLHQEHWIVDGAASMTVAGLLQARAQYQGKRVVLVLCSRNVDDQRLTSLLAET